MTELLHKELTGAILRVYYDVYNGTSRTYPEYIYEQAMQEDLLEKGIRSLRQPEYQIFYKDKLVGEQHLDLFVAQDVVVEIKVAPELTKLHKAQALSYLKVVGKQVGLLCNFGGSAPQFERLYFHERPAGNRPETVEATWPAELLTPELTYSVLSGLYDIHTTLGPGFIYRIYANAVYHEMRLRGLDVVPRRVYEVIYRGRPVGAIKFEHVQVSDALMIFPVAIQDVNDVGLNNLKAWLRAQKIPLGILANFYPASLEFVVLRV
ncbi:MAG: GxxExxY protein [Chloroflexota bacterium]